MNSAITKINEEAKTVSGQNVPAIAIKDYIVSKCESDEEFAKLVEKPEKCLSKCFTYLSEVAYQRAKAQQEATKCNNICIGMSGDEIFAIVDEYFALDEEELARRKEEEKKAAEEERKKQDEEARKKRAEKQKAKAAEKPKGKADNSPEQVSFFDEISSDEDTENNAEVTENDEVEDDCV